MLLPVCNGKDMEKNEVHQPQKYQELKKNVPVEYARVQTTGDRVIDRIQTGKDRTVHLVRWQGTEGTGILEEQRQVLDGSNVGIVDDGVRIIEMELTVEVVGVDQQQGGEEERDQPRCNYGAQT